MSATPAQVSTTLKVIGGVAALALAVSTGVAVSHATRSTPSSPAAPAVSSPPTSESPSPRAVTTDPTEPPATTAVSAEDPPSTDALDAESTVAASPEPDDPSADAPVDGDVPDDSGDPQPGPYVPPAPAGPGSGTGPSSPTPLDPTEPAAPTPCDAVAHTEQSFVIDSDVVLERDVFDGSLKILNCIPHPVELTVSTHPTVTLETAAVTIPAEDTTSVGFTIDGDAWGDGSIDFEIHVEQGDCCADHAHVHGFKGDLVNDFVAATDFAIDPALAGCSTGCISSALLTPRTLTTDIDIAVTTNTPAEIDVLVSKQAPVQNQAGDPAFPGLAPSASTDGLETELDATLTGLEAATDYPLIVRATDEFGHATVAHHAFRSVTPAKNDGGDFTPAPGCAASCIMNAQVTPTGATVATVDVATSLPASFEVWVGTNEVDTSSGTPHIPGAIIRVTSDGASDSWNADITGLDPGTTYSIVLTAVDEYGGSQSAVAQFSTDPPTSYEVTAHIERIDITHQGERIKWDRGEITIAWAYDGELVGVVPEQKMDEGDKEWISSSNVVRDSVIGEQGFDGLEVVVGERDGTILGFCEAPISGLECKGVTWQYQNVPSLTANEVYLLPACWTLGYPDDDHRAHGRCLKVSSPSSHVKQPGFDTIIRYTVQPLT